MSHPAIGAAALAATIALSTEAAAQCHDYAALAAIQQELFASAPSLAASCLRVEQSGALVHLTSTGGFDPLTVVPIASATKTLSAAVLMSLVDDGTLQLDDRVSDYLPEWDVGLKRFITLRQCFSHTSGMVTNDPVIFDDTITLRQAAQQAAMLPLEAVPGTSFAYGNVAMHVAGAVCEVASGQSFSALFEQRIATPLGMTSTDYFGPGVTANPLIAGGARSNARDYARFCSMLRDGGAFGSAQVLSEASVDELLTDQTSGLPVASTPTVLESPYGIGIWLIRQGAAGETLLAAGIGAFGFTGWVDRAHDSSGVLAVEFLAPVTTPFVQRIWSAIDDAMLPPGIACAGDASPPCVPDAWLNGNRVPTAGVTDFAIRLSQARPMAPGILAVADGVTGGVPVFDLDVWLAPGLQVVAGVLANEQGRAVVAAPLDAAMAGQTVALQAAWFVGQPCTAVGLSASHALVVTVQ